MRDASNEGETEGLKNRGRVSRSFCGELRSVLTQTEQQSSWRAQEHVDEA